MEQIERIAATPPTVLVEGEAGSGKTAAAWVIHALGPRRDRPFVIFDCAATAPEAQEEALFGGEAGGRLAPGALERAEGGTLYLAGIGEATHAVQVRLLRLLHDRAFERVDGERTLRADVRLIAGTRRGLGDLVRDRSFRDDLLARLTTSRIVMPPLRERAEDIPLLVERFLREANRRHRRGVKRVTRGVLERLQRHPWPGNVRELRDTIEAMVVSAPGGRPLDLADLPQSMRADGAGPEPARIAPGMTVEEAVRALIVATLEHVGDDRPRAAAMLGIGLRTLYRRIKQYGLR